MPPLADFGEAEPFATAMAQQLFLIQCVYRQSFTRISDYLDLEGVIVSTHGEADTWPPSYVLVRSVGKRYFLALCGTVTTVQGFYQGPLENTRRPMPGGSAYVGNFWLAAAQDVLASVLPLLPLGDPDTRVYTSGHSFGGSVAFLVGCEVARIIGNERVQCATFGQPRTVSAGYNGPRPGVYWRIYSPHDPVPTLLLDLPGLLTVDPHNPFSWLDAMNPWQHYGAPRSIAMDGSMNSGRDVVYPVPPRVGDGPLGSHSLENYIARIREYGRITGDSQVTADAISAAFAARDSTVAETPRISLRLDDLGLPPAVWPDYIARTNLFGSLLSGGGGGMGVMTHTWLFHGADSEEWTETYTLNKDVTPATSLQQITSEMRALRLGFLSNANKLKSVRASQIEDTRSSIYRNFNERGTAQSPDAVNAPEPVGVAAVYDIRGASGGRRFAWFRGLRDTTVNRGMNGQDAISADADSAIKAWIAAAGTFGYGIRRRAREGDGDASLYRQVTRADGAITPGHTILYVSSTTGIAVRDRVTLSMFSDKDLPQINAIFEVLGVTPTTILIRYTTPDNRDIIVRGGRLRLLIWKPVSSFDATLSTFSHFGTRDTKRSFTHSRGGSRVRRMRHLD